MGRKAKGTVTYIKGKDGELGHYAIRITCPDGSRPWFHLSSARKSKRAEAKAREQAAAAAERVNQEGLGGGPQRHHESNLASGSLSAAPGQHGVAPGQYSVPRSRQTARRRSPGVSTAPLGGTVVRATQAETVTQWSERWLQNRRDRGHSSVDKEEGRLRKHAFCFIGELLMHEVTSDHLETIVEYLDRVVRDGELAWKSAVNVWGLLTKMFDDACHSKVRSLRVLSENPAAGVQGPDHGNKKAKAYLYPSEFLTLVSCNEVPLIWRRAYTLTTYLFLRASELDVLEREDFDMGAKLPVVRIHRAWDEERRRVKPAKNKDTRTFTIEPTLVPLLKAMWQQSGRTGRLLRLPRGRRHSTKLREHLNLAGVTRAALFTNDATRINITFHDLKATGVTWMAVRGDPPLRIMGRAAHKDIRTTMGYVRTAEAVVDSFGEVFPELPRGLLGGKTSQITSKITSENTQVSEIIAERVGFEPTVRFRTHDFQSCTFGLSVISPELAEL